jgi:hypothetical protein
MGPTGEIHFLDAAGITLIVCGILVVVFIVVTLS